MLNEYGRTGILLLFAVMFPALPLMISFLLRALKIRPDLPDAVKNDTYECGVETEGDSWVQFNFKYYLVALLFVVFDVEVVFLYTWAVAFPEYLMVGIIEAMTFIGILGHRLRLRLAQAGAGVAMAVKTPALAGSDVAARLNAALPGIVIDSGADYATVPSDRVVEAAMFLRDDEELDCKYLNTLLGIDWLDHFVVVYVISSLAKNHSFVLKARSRHLDPVVPSVSSVWLGAHLQEREVYDLMGIAFSDHPDLKRIFLWEGFPGHPLRKDFLALPGGYKPGLQRFPFEFPNGQRSYGSITGTDSPTAPSVPLLDSMPQNSAPVPAGTNAPAASSAPWVAACRADAATACSARRSKRRQRLRRRAMAPACQTCRRTRKLTPKRRAPRATSSRRRRTPGRERTRDRASHTALRRQHRAAAPLDPRRLPHEGHPGRRAHHRRRDGAGLPPPQHGEAGRGAHLHPEHPVHRPHGLPGGDDRQPGATAWRSRSSRASKCRTAASYLRVIFAELQRIASHCMANGTFVNDCGAWQTPLMYMFREREKILDLFEMTCGARLTTNYMRIGGVAFDVPDEWYPARQRPRGRDAGPHLRVRRAAAGQRDPPGARPRRRHPQAGRGDQPRGQRARCCAPAASPGTCARPTRTASTTAWSSTSRSATTATATTASWCAWRRCARASASSSRRWSSCPAGPINTPIPLALKPEPGEAYARIESPKGELGFYLVSDGAPTPYRWHVRSPSFINLSVLKEMTVGLSIADAIVTLGSLDINVGEIDR